MPYLNQGAAFKVLANATSLDTSSGGRPENTAINML